MKNIVTIFLVLFVNMAFSQDTPQRKPFELILNVDGENFYRQDVKASPYFVKEKILQIYPSEKLNIEVEILGDTIASMKVVDKNTNPKKTIELEIKQQSTNKIHEQIILTVNNPFDKSLLYDAHMYRVGDDQWRKTSIIPVGQNCRHLKCGRILLSASSLTTGGLRNKTWCK